MRYKVLTKRSSAVLIRKQTGYREIEIRIVTKFDANLLNILNYQNKNNEFLSVQIKNNLHSVI